jgi:hypothetical protein
MNHGCVTLRILLLWLAGLLPTALFADEQTDAPIEPEITREQRDHWAYRPLSFPLPAARSRSDWSSVPLDLWIEDALRSANIEPLPQANAETLLRRLKLDLLGLPPSQQEIDEYLSDPSPDKYEQRVDLFLASPRYGERWAQMWLDVARYADTDGFEHDHTRKDSWTYRDWVIRAWNEDMPFERFVRMQLAGDLTDSDEHRIATMFGLAGPDMPDINDQELRRHDRLNDLTSTIGSALLGMQFHCAQCHDHVYDPISQLDFYRLRAVFESAIPPLRRDQPFLVFDTSKRSDTTPKFYARGELKSAGMEVEKAPPRILRQGALAFSPEKERLHFVDWLFQEENPLPARVFVNRLWTQYFGQGIFPNPNDVGVMGGAPSHPEVLDWLAGEFRQDGWSIKSIQRRIVLSSTYRQSSRREGTSLSDWNARREEDPDNKLLSRFPRRRMHAEVIRDSMLAASGQIHFEMYGEGCMPPLPSELLSTLLKGQWKASESPTQHSRRSIYTFARRNLRLPIFDVFDRPDASASCGKRESSTTATQSLQMMNSEFSQSCAESLYQKSILSMTGVDPGEPYNQRLLEQIFVSILSRYPSDAERDWVHHYVSDSPDDPKLWQSVILSLFNTNEFITIE